MDIDTVSAIERLTERIDSLENRIERHGDHATRRDERLRSEISEGLAEARRHAVMLTESTRDDIRLVAEAVAILTVKVEALDSRLR